MAHWLFTILVFIITLVILIVVKVHFLIFLLVFVPLLTIVFIMLSFSYSFRNSLKAENLKREVGNTRLEELDRLSHTVTALGFEKIDQFYLRMVPDTIVYAFKLKNEPIYFCLYHLGAKKACDMFTTYNNSYTLTTCDNLDGGMTPRPKENFLQIFPHAPYDKIVEEHRRAHKFLTDNRFKAYDLAGQDFRVYFTKEIKKFSTYVRKKPFWPVLLLFWTVTVHGRKYRAPIKFQYETGRIKFS